MTRAVSRIAEAKRFGECRSCQPVAVVNSRRVKKSQTRQPAAEPPP